MMRSSRTERLALKAPGIVHQVLRQTGSPLQPLVRRTLGGDLAARSAAAASGVGEPLLVDHRNSLEEAEAERLAGPVAEGAELPSRLAFNFDRIRIHTDARAAESARMVRARAYTVGTDIVFAENQYRPASAEGQRLIAHELVHAAQAASESALTLHRYEAPEHQDFGDSGLTELAAFLQTREGEEFARKLGNPAGLKELQADAFLAGRKFKVQGVELSVGDIIAMAGDFYPTPAAMMNADPEELKEIRDAINDERAGKLEGGKANERYQEITQKYIGRGTRAKENTFIGMAKVNAPHFTPTNRDAWKLLHKQALETARTAGKDQAKLDTALLIDTFGGHFLSDAFASGHLFDKNKLELQVDLWLARNKVAPTNPEMASYYAIIGKNTGQLILKNIHDRLNAEGVEVSNKRGMRWKTFGDDHLKSAPQSLRLGALAVFESRRQVLEASRLGPESTDSNDDALCNEVLDLLPEQTSVDQATAKAVSYIPWAAQSLTPLIYRQRGAGALELKAQLGVAGTILSPIIKSNIAAIADPGREKQLLQLEEESLRLNIGKRLAPQFTVFDF